MEKTRKLQNMLRSQSKNVILAKLWMPLVALGIAVGVFGRDAYSWRLVLCLPIVIAAFFGISLAIIELREDGLYYKRFFKWRKLPHDEILRGEVEWAPIIGSIRLKRFMFPWGRLYFVLDRNLKINPFNRSDYALLRYVNGDVVGQDKNSSKFIATENQWVWLKLVVICLGGAILSFLLQISLRQLPPNSVLEHQNTSNQPYGSTSPLHFVQTLNRTPYVQILFVLFVVLAAYKRRGPDAWIYALLAGIALPYFFS